MNGPREMLDRIREERRVRRDFEKLIASNDLTTIDTDWVGDRGERGRTKKKPPIWRRGWKWWVVRVALALVVLMVAGTVAFLYAPLPFEPPRPLQTAFVYDRNGNLLATIRPDQDRVVLPFDKIPKIVREAVIASEDERFYSHSAVDVRSILRAAWNDVRGRHLQGGSTITQQLVKQIYVGNRRSLWRKLREAALAVRMERKYTKDEILARYLNIIYLGENAYGVEAAARQYFGISIQDVSLGQAALLASIAPAPTRYNPRADLAGAAARRDHVLDRMVVNHFVSAAQADAAKAEPVEVAPPKPPVSVAPAFVQYVRGEIERMHGPAELSTGGLQITTTLDVGMQAAAQRAIAETLNEPGDPAAALVAIDVHTGEIRAMAQRGGGYFNLAAQGAGRQAGSAFKPFVLAAALTDGMSPYASFDGPSCITIGDWHPCNYDGGAYGFQTVRSATIHSINTVYAQIIERVGPAKVAAIAHRMGIQSPLDADLTLTLGTSSVQPLEMADAYATLATGGVHHAPIAIRGIVDSEGKAVQGVDTATGTRALSRTVAATETGILQDVIRFGTGAAAALSDYDAAGKTGTTNSHRDAWFCGYTADLATCVWMGYKKPRPMENVHGIRVAGGTFPAQIWNRFMSAVPLPTTELDTVSGYTGIPTPTPGPSPSGGPPSPAPSESTPPPTTPPSNCGILPIC